MNYKYVIPKGCALFPLDEERNPITMCRSVADWRFDETAVVKKEPSTDGGRFIVKLAQNVKVEERSCIEFLVKCMDIHYDK